MSHPDVDAEDLTLPIKRTDGDTMAARLTANAYNNILPARYLRKDADGSLVEDQEELFPRVAKNIALAEAAFEADRRDVRVTVTPDQLKPQHPRRDELAAEVFGEGTTVNDDVETRLTPDNVSKFAYDTVVPELPGGVADHVREVREEFEGMMGNLDFMPNSPTLMNAGDELQQLSACFVDSPADDIDDIHETAKEAAQVFQCLTEDARVAVEGKGVISVADVEPGDRVVQRDDDGYRSQNVEEVHAYDEAPTVKLTTAGGVPIRGTPNHRLLVNGEWTELTDIAAGDSISLRLGWLTDADETGTLTAVDVGPQWETQRTVSNEAIAALHADGASDYAIAEELGCSASTVQRRRANELELAANGDGGREPGASFDEERFAVLHETGRSDSEIADALGIHQTTVQQHRAARDLETNGGAVKSVSQPRRLTEDLAELLGIWVGDGSVHEDGIRFHLNRDDVLNHVDTLARELFDTGVDHTWDDGCYEAVIHSNEVKRWWLENFGDAKVESATARIPDVLWRADHDTVAAFLRGLFSTDGTLTKGRYPRLYSASEQLIDESLQLLLGIGIPATKWDWENEDRDYFSVAPTDATGLERFADSVGYVDTRTEEMEMSLSETPPEPTQYGTVKGNSWTQPVASVEDADPATVYDLTVADDHEYVAQSVVSHNSGGGMGYAFWQLRPYGDTVGSTGGIASGPITFMRTFDQMCETIAQGGTRRGAQMGVMRVSHPDVIQFIHAKNKDVSLATTLRLNDPSDYTHTSFKDALEEARELIDDEGKVPKHLRNAVEGHLSNFNISVGVTDDFMEALQAGEEFTFTNPRTGEPHVATEHTREMYEWFGLGDHVEVGEELSIPAEIVWERIVEGAHENGEPGVIYLERVNKQHSFDVDEHPNHRILATNPCGEQPLEEYEACNLGHINLSTLADTHAPDWRVWSEEHADEYDSLEAAVDAYLQQAIDVEELDHRIEYGTRFLENVVTMSDFPVEDITEKVREMRKIGLGVMGLAQLYIQLGVKYGSDEGNEIARQLMRHIDHGSKAASHDLALDRGSFADWEDSKYADPTSYPEWFEHHTGEDPAEWAEGFHIRNHNTTTIAPTGCVEENSLVSTDHGLVPIERLDETTAEFEQWDEIEVGVSTDGGTKTATAVYDNGFADVRRIATAGGFSVAATPDHRFRTITDDGEYTWRDAGSFEPGDRIVLQRGTFDGHDSVTLDTSERANYYHNTDDNLRLPGEISPELAAFLGYFMGDGYVHEGVGVKLVVGSDAEELDAHLRELGESLFGVEPTVEDKGTRHVLSFGGRHLPRYFLDNGWKKDDGNEGEGAASAFVPEQILESDEACARAFLRGLFEADGTASRKVELSTVSETLADQVQMLLLSLGVVFVRDELDVERLGDDHYGERTRYSLRGANNREDERFLETIGFVTKTTEVDLSARSHKNDTYPPAVVDLLRDVDGYEQVSSDVKHRVNQSPVNGAVSRKTVRDVERQSGSTVTIDGRRLREFYVATVETVEDDVAYTKDISVPENNTYVANGFVTHNTTSMIGNTSGGCEPIYNVAYYKNVGEDVQGDDMLVEFDDYFLRTLEANDIDVDGVKEEAQRQMANNVFDGVEGLESIPDAIAELFVTTQDLTAKEHAAVQCACQEGVDSAISKCLEKGTLVQTDSGVRPIESFADETPEQGEFVEITEDVTIDGVPVESQYYAGEKDATRVRVDNGTELVGATESHRVLTPDGWKVLGELGEGDYVVGRHVESHGEGGSEITVDDGPGIATDGGAASALGGGRSVHEKDTDVPGRMSPSLARFLGMYAADGSAIDDRYSVEISTSSERVREEARDLFVELFGREPTVEEDTRHGEQRDTVFNVGVNSKLVWEFVTALCGSGAYEKRVPRELLQGSPEEKRAFVNGVTLDGYVSSQSLVVYGGMSKNLADGVASLLRSFGVPTVYLGRKWVDEADAYAYNVHVTNDAQKLVTPVEPHKRVDRFDQRYRVYVPQDRVDRTEYYSRSSEYYAARNFEYRDRNYMFDTTAEKLGITDAPPLYEVTDVEDAGTREMYDIELAGPHEYVVGGVVSHNTVNAPNEDSVEDAQEVFEYVYEHGGKGVTYYRDGTRSKQVLTTRADNTEFADEAEAAEQLVAQIEEVFGGIDAFVESEEVREAVDAEVADLLEGVDQQVDYAEKRSRPDALRGVSQRIETGYGRLYVTINEDPETGEPFELFANIGHSGGFTNSFTEALAKVISTALRSGVDPREIVDELCGTRSPKVAWDKGEQIQSIPDAIGTALRRYLDDEVDKAYPDQATLDESADQGAAEPEPDGGAARGATQAGTDGPEPEQHQDATQDLIENGESPECPECGSMQLYYSEGCKTCEGCGWSEC